jgi:hypothetical protein
LRERVIASTGVKPLAGGTALREMGRHAVHGTRLGLGNTGRDTGERNSASAAKRASN